MTSPHILPDPSLPWIPEEEVQAMEYMLMARHHREGVNLWIQHLRNNNFQAPQPHLPQLTHERTSSWTAI